MRPLPTTEQNFGPTDGKLTLHTTCEGAASRMGHDLTLVIADWRAVVTPAEAGTVDIRLTAELSSLEVERGDGGLKPLSSKDRNTILKNALGALKARDYPRAIATLEGVRGDATGAVGTLTIAGLAKPLTIDFAETATMVTASASVVQTDFGVKPYSTMLGALKVGDLVTVKLEVASS